MMPAKPFDVSPTLCCFVGANARFAKLFGADADVVKFFSIYVLERGA